MGDQEFKEAGLVGINAGGQIIGLGTHSYRKKGSTHARKNGIGKDDRDLRGRRRGHKRVVDVYDDTELPWVDTKVAVTLCIGGPVKYAVADSNVNKEFIFTNVYPAKLRHIPHSCALVLGTALLYYCFTSTGSEHVPPYICDRVTNAYRQLERRTDEPMMENPVNKVGLIPSGNEGQVFLDEVIPEFEQQTDQSNTRSSITDRPMRDQLRGLHSQVSSLRNTIERFEQKIASQQVAANRYFQSINSNIRRVGLSPARPGGAQASVSLGNSLNRMTLRNQPRTLYDLWQEYSQGFNGQKVEKDQLSVVK
jgi:hypothetical protein